MQSLATQAVSCINTFGMPVALAALKWKSESMNLCLTFTLLTGPVPAYIIFAVFDFIGIFVIYFFAVETKVGTKSQIAMASTDILFTTSKFRWSKWTKFSTRLRQGCTVSNSQHRLVRRQSRLRQRKSLELEAAV